jgi:trk system potassium uptake protein TrkA
MIAATKPYVLVIGGGKVGFHLAQHLINLDYEVTLVEKDPVRAGWIEQQLGTVSVMVGDGDEMAFLATTGVERAGVLVAATGEDEDNLVVCQLAKQRFNVARTIARVNAPANIPLFRAAGIDVPVSATELLVGLIESELSGSEMLKGLNVRGSGATLADVAVPPASPYLNRPLSAISLPEGTAIVCIMRDGRLVLPDPAQVVLAGDEIIVYSKHLDVEALRGALA